ncbi:hypothetical protein FO519_006933 [Halicephalobus sp. NKZ332]|nr:hypothetical protein FO519_006933 [Halicephalobus sp. NKZ332]
MFSCRDKCVVVDRPTAAEGVISVIINRTIPTTTISPILPLVNEEVGVPQPTEGLSSSEFIPSSFPRPPIGINTPSAIFEVPTRPPDFDQNINVSSSTFSSTHEFLAQYTPVWAVGVAIVIAVVCIGLNVVLVSAFCCYKRHKNRMRSENFTHIKAPTLHAFNPAT